MASFQAKTGGERPRKSENKNYCPDQFLHDSLQRKRENKNYHSKQFLLDP